MEGFRKRRPKALGEGRSPEARLELGTLGGKMISGAASEKRTLNEFHSSVSNCRDTGTGHYLITRSYPSGDAECTALTLHHDDSIRKGGGAKRKSESKDEMKWATLFKSVQRAKTKIRRLCLSAQVDRLLTLTFRENVTDLDEAWAVFKYFAKLMRWRFKERWLYVAVPEEQKRGAIHFHLAVKGWYNVNTVRKLWRRACGEREGNIDITDPRKVEGKNSWNPRRIANYIAKYISKTDAVDLNRKRYSSGGQIVVPQAVCGWLPISINETPVRIMEQLLNAMTRRSIFSVWQSTGHFKVYMVSTE